MGAYALDSRLVDETLYEACAAFPDEERRRGLGAFVRNVHGPLNHMLLGGSTRRPASSRSIPRR